MSHGPDEYGGLRQSSTFKVLNILPPNEDPLDVVRCEVLTESLVDAASYEALSYTWGSTVQDWPVLIAAKILGSSKTSVVRVSEHLYSALLQLRRPNGPRRVWIDQICINQQNIPEKNAQVRLMAEIYQRAERTVVWLGQIDMKDDDRNAIIDAADRMTFRPVEREYSTPNDQLILKDLIGFQAQGDSLKLGQRRRQVLAALLNQSWFTRAWVYQEVVVAKRGIVLCGDFEMDMDIFINLLDGVCELDMQEVGEAASIMHSSRGYKPMFAIREARFESRNGLSSDKKSKWLSTLWQAMGNLDATNPRDKVYAFLAFADSTEDSRVAPSYEKSIESVYSDATIKSVRSLGSLDVLELAHKDGESIHDLPSWVPDFSKPLPSLPFMTHNVGSTTFNASRGLKHPYRTTKTTDIDHQQQLFTVRGHIISTISRICPLSFPTHDLSTSLHSSLHLAEVVHWVRCSQHLNSPVQSLKEEQQIEENDPAIKQRNLESLILRTLLASGAGSTDHPGNLDYNSPLDILATYHNESILLQTQGLTEPFHTSDAPATTTKRIQYRYLKWMKRVSEIAYRKKLFSTREGDMGMGFEGLREGDLVVVLWGGKTGSILRRKAKGKDGDDEEGGERYAFVAQCYVEGWMMGEEVHEEGREWTEEGCRDFVLI
ncbi:MAG: hypothetical protein Q9220_001983 [cf. Caloplaca sp. 1 TL-2023]